MRTLSFSDGAVTLRVNDVEIAILSMIKESLRRGNIDEWLELGWSTDDLCAIRRISITDLRCSSRTPAGRLYSSLAPNRRWLQEYAAKSAEETYGYQLAMELIAFGAPYSVVNELLQIGKGKWRTARLLAGGRKPIGRADFKRVSSPSDVEKIVCLLNEVLESKQGVLVDKFCDASAVLFVTDHSGYSVAEVYRVLCEGRARGEITVRIAAA